jgi:putative MATE family efflux protein
VNENKYGLDLTQGNIRTLLLRFAWPFLVSGLVSGLYGIIDLLVVGQFTTPEIISGVSTGTQMMNLVYSATIGIGTGGTVLIGRRMGERDPKACATAAGNFIMTSIALAVLLTGVVLAAREGLLTVLQTPELARPSASRYVIYTTIGVPFLVGFNMMSALSRGMGNARAPSVIAAVGCAINVVLDFVLVGVFPLKEVGAAIATTIAQIASLAIMVIWQFRRKFPFPFARKDLRIEWPVVGNIFRVGLPLWIQELLVTVSFMIITGIVNAMGVVASASVGIISKVFNLGGIFPLSIGNAIAAMTAQNLGAGRRDRALKSLKWGIGYSLIIDAVLCLYCQIAPETITALFTTDAAVITGAAAYLRSFSIDLLFVAFIFCANAYLSGCGKASVSMIHSLSATFALRVPLSIFVAGLANLTVDTQLYYLGFAAPIASLLSIAIAFTYILRQQRRYKREEAGIV